MPARKIARSLQEAGRDKARAIAKRGPSGAKDEFLLAATAQNLRKLAKLIPIPTPIFATSGEAVAICPAEQ
jgi:hypothetical protein